MVLAPVRKLWLHTPNADHTTRRRGSKMFGFNRPFISARTACSDPRSPNYDDSRDDRIADEAREGSVSLKQSPCEVLRALADLVSEHDEDAVRELLRPLYAERQSLPLQTMHRWFSESDSARDVAELALQREYAA